MSKKYTGKALRRENSWLGKDPRAGTKLDLSLQEKQGKVRPGSSMEFCFHLTQHLIWENISYAPGKHLTVPCLILSACVLDKMRLETRPCLLLLTYYHGWSLVTFKKAMKSIHHKFHHLSHFEVLKSVDLYVEVVQPTLLPLSIKCLRGNPVLQSNTPHLHLL